LNLASAAAKAGDLDKSIETWKTVIRENPNRTDVRVNLANALWINKDYDGAKYHYYTALQNSPNNAEAQNGMGLWYLRNSKLPEAKAAFQSSIRANAKFATAYNNLAVTLERMNQRKQAIGVLERATKIAPDNQQITDNLRRMKAAG
jgi:tetratricopeptide (TPR) repeat protein